MSGSSMHHSVELLEIMAISWLARWDPLRYHCIGEMGPIAQPGGGVHPWPLLLYIYD